MANLDVQNQSLQIPLYLVQLELRIKLERLERMEIFCNSYLIDKALYTPPSRGQVGQASKVTRLHGYKLRGYLSRLWVGRSIWAGGVSSKSSKTPKK